MICITNKDKPRVAAVVTVVVFEFSGSALRALRRALGLRRMIIEFSNVPLRLFIILCQVNFTDRYGFLSAPQNGLRAVIVSNSNFGWGGSSAQRPSIYPRKAA